MSADLATIRAMLQARAGDLARVLAPGGHERHGKYEAINPTRNDRKSGSFYITTTGPKAGSFVDYAGVNAPFVAGGDRGDVIDLIAYLRCGRDRKAAIRWAKDYLGLSAMTEQERQGLVERARRMKREAEQKQDADRKKKHAAVLRLWLDAKPGLTGTLAERYLTTHRAIDLSAIAHLERDDLRFRERLEWWRGAMRNAVGQRVAGPVLPAIVCRIRTRDGATTAAHCTFLDPVTAMKADVEAPKLMYGDVLGGVIRISRGPTGLSPEDWIKAADAGQRPEPGPVILCEGLEDGLTLAEAAPEARVWATTSLGNLGHAYVDHPCVSDIIVARDNAWGRMQAEAAFDKAMEALRHHGKPVTEMSALLGKDFNDQAQTGDSP
jgi:hypothetical protein